MYTIGHSSSIRVYQSISITSVHCSRIVSIPIYSKNIRLRTLYSRPNLAIVCKESSADSPFQPSEGEDFVIRVLKENPSQVEPKFQVGGKVYTLKERENLKNRSFDTGAFEILRRLNLKNWWTTKSRYEASVDNGGLNSDGSVYLKDILREYRGKLYVPEQIFGANLSEEQQFDRNFEALPKMSYEEFVKFTRSDKVKLLTAKEADRDLLGNGFRDFIVELKDAPGAKSFHRNKWAMRLDDGQAQALMEEYKGPQYQIETRTVSWIEKLPEYPNPVASTISSRIMVEFGMITAVMAGAALFVGGFLASAVFAVTSFLFVAAVYVVWPLVRPFLKIFLSIFLGILDRVWDNIVDIFSDGGIFSKFYQFYTFGGVSASLEMLKPIMLVFLTMVLLVRFTLSRRPKNFRKIFGKGLNFLNPNLRLVLMVRLGSLFLMWRELRKLLKNFKSW